MKKRKRKHLLIEEVYHPYNLKPGTELLFIDPTERFKVPPARVEVIDEFEYYFLVRAYFGDEDSLSKERSYVTTVDKFQIYNESVYICRDYRREKTHV